MKQLSYRQKNMALLGFTLVLGWVIWSYALSATVELSHSNTDMEQQLVLAEQAPATVGNLHRQLDELDALFGTPASTDAANRAPEEIYDYVSRHCTQHGLSIHQYPAPHEFHSDLYHIETERIVVEGNYHDLLVLLHALERTFGKVRVASVHFYSEKNRLTNKTKLYAHFYLQTIEHVG